MGPEASQAEGSSSNTIQEAVHYGNDVQPATWK